MIGARRPSRPAVFSPSSLLLLVSLPYFSTALAALLPAREKLAGFFLPTIPARSPPVGALSKHRFLLKPSMSPTPASSLQAIPLPSAATAMGQSGTVTEVGSDIGSFAAGEEGASFAQSSGTRGAVSLDGTDLLLDSTPFLKGMGKGITADHSDERGTFLHAEVQPPASKPPFLILAGLRAKRIPCTLCLYVLLRSLGEGTSDFQPFCLDALLRHLGASDV